MGAKKNRTVLFNVRLTEDDRALLSDLTRALGGETDSTTFRSLVRDKAGELGLFPNPASRLDEIRSERRRLAIDRGWTKDWGED